MSRSFGECSWLIQKLLLGRSRWILENTSVTSNKNFTKLGFDNSMFDRDLSFMIDSAVTSGDKELLSHM